MPLSLRWLGTHNPVFLEPTAAAQMALAALAGPAKLAQYAPLLVVTWPMASTVVPLPRMWKCGIDSPWEIEKPDRDDPA